MATNPPNTEMVMRSLLGYSNVGAGDVPTQLLKDLLTSLNLVDYSLIGLLEAIGNMGESVCFAALDGLKRKLCVKVAKPTIGMRQSWAKIVYSKLAAHQDTYDPNILRQRFVDGCKIQRRLNNLLRGHQDLNFYIPDVYDVKERPWLYCVQEFAEGRPLLSWLKERNDLVYSLETYTDLLFCMNFVHSQAIVHRDLKSANIFWGGAKEGRGRVIVLDWTICKELGIERTALGIPQQLGSLPYTSPKVMLDGRAGEATYVDDVFSLGMILWECIQLDKLPRPLELSIQTSIEDFAIYITWLAGQINHEGLKRVFVKATHIEQERRYQTVAELYQDLHGIVESLRLARDAGKHLAPGVIFDCEKCGRCTNHCCQAMLTALKLLKQEGTIRKNLAC
jgi:serine/threonine protein kinase